MAEIIKAEELIKLDALKGDLKDVIQLLIDAALKTVELTDSLKKAKPTLDSLTASRKKLLDTSAQLTKAEEKAALFNEKLRQAEEKTAKATIQREQAQKRATIADEKAAAAAEKLIKAKERGAKSTNTWTTALGSFAAKFNTIGNVLGGAILNVLSNVANKMRQFGSEIIDQTKRLDGLDKAYKSVIPNANQLDQVYNRLNAIAVKYGISILDLKEQYLGFAAASKGTTLEGEKSTKIFEAVTGAMAKLGKDTETQKRALTALTQMMSKGNVAAEELRGQLGEALPGSFGLMSRALGVTTEGLNDMLKAGKVIAADALPKLADEINKSFGLDSSGKVDTLSAAMGRAQTATTSFIQGLQASDFIKNIVNGFASMTQSIADFISKPLSEKLRDEQTELNTLVGAISSVNEKQSVRNGLIKELREKYPELLGNIKDEEINNELLYKRLKEVNDEYLTKINLAILEEELVKKGKELQNTLKNQRDVTIQITEEYNKLVKNKKEGATIDEKLLAISNATTTVMVGQMVTEQKQDKLAGMFKSRYISNEEKINKLKDEQIALITEQATLQAPINAELARQAKLREDEAKAAKAKADADAKAAKDKVQWLKDERKETEDIAKGDYLQSKKSEVKGNEIIVGQLGVIKNINQEINNEKSQQQLNEEDQAKRRMQLIEEEKQARIEAAQLVGDIALTASDLSAALNDRKLQEIDKNKSAELTALEEKYNKDIEAAGDNEEKKKKIKDKYDKEKIKAEEKYAKEAAKIKRKQAIFDKIAAFTAASINLALAIIKSLPNPLLTTLTSTLGGLQLAAIAASPIPEFAKGVQNFAGGIADVGDGGENELIRTSDNKWFMSPATRTRVFLPKGSDVYSGKETKEIMQGGISEEKLNQLISETRATKNAIKSINIQNTHITGSGIQRVNKQWNSIETFKNIYFA